MSSIMDIHALKQLDKRTNDIVFGYMRRNEKQLLSMNNNCNYYRIHSLIQYKVLDFVRDFFMFNYGEYKWCITDDIDNNRSLISFIKSFENGQKHESQIFEIGKLKWRIEAYPNGYHKDSIGSFKLYVKLLSLPPNWSNIIVCRTTECLESYSKVTNVCKYKKDESYGWTTGSLLLKEIKDNKYKTLTFKITIRILQINLKQNNNNNDSHHQINIKYNKKATILYQIPLKSQYVKRYHIKWKISERLMKKMKLANVGKKFESKIFDDMWGLQCCPNGRNSKSQGAVRIYLQLCGLPKGIGSICIQYEIYCDEIKRRDKDTKILGLTTSTWVKTENCTTSFSKFRSFKEVNIRAKIQIITEYDVNGHDLTIEEKEKEWNEYINEQDENQLFCIKQKENLKEFKLMRDRLELQTERLDKLSITTKNIDKICDGLSQKINKEWDAYIDEETQNEEYSLKQKQKENNNKYCIVNNRYKIEIETINKTMNSMSNKINYLMNQISNIQNNNNHINNNNNNNNNDNDKNQNKLSIQSPLILTSKQEKVKKWLINEVDLEQYFDVFIENGFDDLDTIKVIDMNELNQIGIKKLGHRVKMLHKIKDLAKDNNN